MAKKSKRRATAQMPRPTVPQRPPTKAERKAEAKALREEIRRKIARRRRIRRITVPAVVVAVGAAIALFVAFKPSHKATPFNPANLPGMQRGPAPWAVETTNLAARLSADGLPATDGPAFHHHDLLQIFVHGHAVQVPQAIGYDPVANSFAPMHTHDTSGIMHIESPVARTFTLGNFFDIWGVYFTRSCLGSYCASGSDQLLVYVNGNLRAGNGRDIALGQHDDVVVTFGTQAELPNPIPSTYSASISQSCAPSC